MSRDSTSGKAPALLCRRSPWSPRDRGSGLLIRRIGWAILPSSQKNADTMGGDIGGEGMISPGVVPSHAWLGKSTIASSDALQARPRGG